MARLFCAISATLTPGDIPPEMDDYAIQAELYALLSGWPDDEWSEPFGLLSLAQYDQTHGTMLAQKAARVYSMFVSEAGRIVGSSSPAWSIVDKYQMSLQKYLQPEENHSDAPPDRDDNHSKGSSLLDSSTCTRCIGAYELLELPYGAGILEVKQAQRELAKNLHPDLWEKKRGRRVAEGQLKQINAACDHLLVCRFSDTDGQSQDAPAPATGSLGIIEVAGADFAPIDHAVPTVIGPRGAGALVRAHNSENVVPRPPSGNQEHLTGRILLVFVRTVWRFAKILLATLMVSVAAIIVLIGICATLSRYWEGQRSGQKHQVDRGLLDSGILSFLEAVTWVPRQIWGGLMLIVTPLVLLLAFSGASFVQFVSSNLSLCAAVASLLGLSILAWAFHKEWQAEFASTSD
jgi:hypothetical protein